MLRVSELGVALSAHRPRRGRPVSFSVDRGEVLALVGESGSGKTVTAQAVLGSAALLGSDRRGSVQLTDDPAARPAHQAAEPARRAPDGPMPGAASAAGLAAMVFQEPQTALNPVKTVGWQLAEALARPSGASASAARARAVELLSWSGSPTRPVARDAYPHQLSGGQKQRVVIALALANDPPC